MKIEQIQLLSELRTVSVGLAEKKTIEQSDCFVFQNGEVMTYNDEVACRTKSCLPITGAVNARKMLDMLERSNDGTIIFELKKGKLLFKGKKKRGFFKMEKNIVLPIADVKRPKKWSKLPPGFTEAVSLVQGCAAQKTPAVHLCCVNITPKWVEACDGIQAGRYKLATPFKGPTLIKMDVVRQVLPQNITNVGFTSTKGDSKVFRTWVHFRNKAGLIISCHTYVDRYPSERLSQIFQTKGEPARLPKELRHLTERVRVFLDDKKGQLLDVEVTPKYIQVTGKGMYGEQTEREKVKYDGKPIVFSVNPDLLKILTDKHDKCEISKRIIMIKKGPFRYVTSLWVSDKA